MARSVPGLGFVLVFAALSGCSSPSPGVLADGGGDGSSKTDSMPDSPSIAAPDASPDRIADDGGGDGASDRGSPQPDMGTSSQDAPSDGPAAEVAPDRPPADMAAACSPAPDQQGFYSSCSACPNPGDCDTIDVNGNRRYACGCGGGCSCGTRCGSYRIPGTAITIGNICVR